jgi:hypothetical protein
MDVAVLGSDPAREPHILSRQQLHTRVKTSRQYDRVDEAVVTSQDERRLGAR